MFWYDGQAQPGDTINLSITDPGLLYGATVFSTVRVYENLAQPRSAWNAHTNRLQQSILAFGWVEPDWARLRCGADWLALDYPVLRVTIFPDGREWITGRSLPSDLHERQTQGITAKIITNAGSRSLGSHKTGNYLTSWLGREMNAGQEGILTDRQGHWRETLTGNLWGWADGTWYTPPLMGDLEILPGIERDRLIQVLRCHNGKYDRVDDRTVWDESLISRLTILAYSNCVVEVVPIHTVGDQAGRMIKFPRRSLFDPLIIC
jgi:4-amino-4-deoxychorismate lyase